VTPATVTTVEGARRVQVADRLATEEPLEIRVAGRGQPAAPVAVTMRTPGHDFELAAGFLFTEGLVEPGEVAAVRYCVDMPAQEQRYNVVTVRLHRPFLAPVNRRFTVGAGCGLCGKTSLDDLAQRCPPVLPGPVVAWSWLAGLPERLRREQRLFAQTGGLHAAGLFEAEGPLLAAREDVGRHNAVDKLVGWAVLGRRLPLAGTVLVLSGRVGFELVQKAAMAGIGLVAAVSAPSSLAVEAADRFGVTVAGFVRGDRANVYCHGQRVDLDA